jgi:CSLREA domain-containing protein
LDGSGISNEAAGSLSIIASTFSGNSGLNSSSGGGVFNLGSLTITSSTFAGNSALSGGGIFNDFGGNLSVARSTFSANMVVDGGAGIVNANPGTSATVTNCTFFDNSASDTDSTPSGGGIANESSASLTVTSSTFFDNYAFDPVSMAGNGGGIANFNDPGTVTLVSDIFEDNPFGGNCQGPVVSGGYNISDDQTCNFGASTGANGQALGDRVNAQLANDGLQNNGGPTQTIALQASSPAIAAVPLAQCTVTTDQRGDPRPALGYGACDIGAYELEAIVVNTLSDSSPSGDHLCSLREAINNANGKSETTGGGLYLGYRRRHHHVQRQRHDHAW